MSAGTLGKVYNAMSWNLTAVIKRTPMKSVIVTAAIVVFLSATEEAWPKIETIFLIVINPVTRNDIQIEKKCFTNPDITSPGGHSKFY